MMEMKATKAAAKHVGFFLAMAMIFNFTVFPFIARYWDWVRSLKLGFFAEVMVAVLLPLAVGCIAVALSIDLHTRQGGQDA